VTLYLDDEDHQLNVEYYLEGSSAARTTSFALDREYRFNNKELDPEISEKFTVALKEKIEGK